MKKTLLSVLLLAVLTGSFLAGAWYNKHRADSNKDVGERKILHYVDPMNPAHTSEKPGTAPCGMPMEPVYSDDGSAGSQTPEALLMSPGTVKINTRKQQIIGIQVGLVEKISETHKIRALGRIEPDENRVYRLIAATDGWMSDIRGGTTGSMVKANQLLALIKIYDYDFYTWQQRYLTELAYRGQRRHPNTPTAQRQAVTQTPEYQHPAGKITSTGQLSGIIPDAMQDPMVSAVPQTGSTESAMPIAEPSNPDETPPEMMNPKNPPESESIMPKASTPQNKILNPAKKSSAVMLGLVKKYQKDPLDERADPILYANKSELELLNLGMGELQLEKLAQTAGYVTNVELRSPVAGLVIARNVSSLQKIDKDTECFRIADIRRVWVVADIFIEEAQYIRPGMSAMVSLPNRNKSFKATVSQVLPQFDASSRTLKVRLEMDNPNNLFLPEMFVDVEFLINFPQTITVSSDAVIDSGARKIVFASLGNGFFEPRTVETGWRFGDRVEIIKGLMPGEQIVLSGNFLIDSESRMKLAAAGLYGAPGICPVCKMDVYPDQAKASGYTVDYQGKTYSLCSNECKTEFNKSPQSFKIKEPGDKTKPVTSMQSGHNEGIKID